jgi:hypothetical protein
VAGFPAPVVPVPGADEAVGLFLAPGEDGSWPAVVVGEELADGFGFEEWPGAVGAVVRGPVDE